MQNGHAKWRFPNLATLHVCEHSPTEHYETQGRRIYGLRPQPQDEGQHLPMMEKECDLSCPNLTRVHSLYKLSQQKFLEGIKMDLETVSAEEFGAGLHGIGLNLLVRNVQSEVAFLSEIFQMTSHRVSDDFAIMAYSGQLFQLHSDATYHANPMLTLLPENPPRGAGIEIRLYDTDPEQAVERAERFGAHILQHPTDKPHGLREAYILCENGYVWVPSRPRT